MRQAGCDKISKDVISGACKTRPGVDEVLNYCRPGDTFVVWELDRLGRSLKHLIDVVEGLKAKALLQRVRELERHLQIEQQANQEKDTIITQIRYRVDELEDQLQAKD